MFCAYKNEQICSKSSHFKDIKYVLFIAKSIYFTFKCSRIPALCNGLCDLNKNTGN